jgi:hypothetical protein
LARKKSDGLPAGDIYPFHRASIRTTPSMMKMLIFSKSHHFKHGLYERMWILTRCACTLQVRPPVSTLGCCWLRQQ